LIPTLLLIGNLVSVSTAQAADQNTLTWTDNSNNEQGFDIYRKSEICTGSVALAKIATVAANVVTYVDTAVVQGVTYCYAVDAFNTAGTSSLSNTASRTVPFTTPAAPSNLLAN